jgi:MFS transporter, DHA1 family, tetracycline resistance protein
MRIHPVLAVVALDCIGGGIVLPVAPRLIAEISGRVLGDSSKDFSLLVLCYSLGLFLCAPAMGRLSDRWGRVPVLVVALCGLTLDYIAFACAREFWVLILVRISAGACGASVSVAAAYISDCTRAEERTSGFALMSAAAGIGVVLGPIVGGMLSGGNLRLPFVVAAVLAALNCVLVVFFLPESLPRCSRRMFNFRDIDPLSALFAFRKFKTLRRLAVSLALFAVINPILPTIWVIFSTEHLDWSPVEVGLSFAFMGTMAIVVPGSLTHSLVRAIGEHGLLFVGCCLITMGFILTGLSRSSFQASCGLFVMTLGWIAGPATTSLLSKQVQDSEQGELQGNLRSLDSVGALIGPAIAGWTYSTFSQGKDAMIPGAPMLVAGVLEFVALTFALPVILVGLSPMRATWRARFWRY